MSRMGLKQLISSLVSVCKTAGLQQLVLLSAIFQLYRDARFAFIPKSLFHVKSNLIGLYVLVSFVQLELVKRIDDYIRNVTTTGKQLFML